MRDLQRHPEGGGGVNEANVNARRNARRSA
jgi:hypothetical protein